MGCWPEGLKLPTVHCCPRIPCLACAEATIEMLRDECERLCGEKEEAQRACYEACVEGAVLVRMTKRYPWLAEVEPDHEQARLAAGEEG